MNRFKKKVLVSLLDSSLGKCASATFSCALALHRNGHNVYVLSDTEKTAIVTKLDLGSTELTKQGILSLISSGAIHFAVDREDAPLYLTPIKYSNLRRQVQELTQLQDVVSISTSIKVVTND